MRPGPSGSSATRKSSSSTQSAAMCSLQLGHRPRALFGVAGEGAVVRLDPWLLVAADDEGPGHQRPGPPPRRRAAAARRPSEQVAFGAKPSTAARSSSAAVACMTQKWIGAAPGASSTARPRSASSSAAGAGGRRVDHHVDDRRPVVGGGEEGDPEHVASLAGHHDALAVWCFGGARHGQLPRLGQGRVIAAAFTRAQQRGARPGPERATPANRPPPCPECPLRHVTRYREPVARPRTAKGRARRSEERLAEVYPGTRRRPVRAGLRGPLPTAGPTTVGPEHRRPGQPGDAGSLRAVSRCGVAGRGEPRTRRGARRSTGFFCVKTRSLIGMGERGG